MKKRALLVLIISALGVAFLFAGVHATQQAPDSVTMHSPVFEKHKKALVTFTHKKHNVDYKLPCADCHHVYKDGKNVWKEGDEVKKCMACHSEAKAPKAKEGEPKLSKAEKIKKYYYSAIHENCVGCHKALKKDAKPTGPSTCKECHPKQ
ncbi:MAG: cytochrome c3 family protein [Thermodesulfobacteriota bacterium]|nr:cytochrome c3 family protein [Thermodesulfobacteriota bacterium]